MAYRWRSSNSFAPPAYLEVFWNGRGSLEDWVFHLAFVSLFLTLAP